MEYPDDIVVVFTTFPDTESAQKLINMALEKKLIACGNIISGVQSYYWWEGAIETAKETQVILKTKTDKLEQLESVILSNHPYKTPELLVLNVLAGSSAYLSWINETTKSD